jgi:hypothetical protein
MIKVPPLSHLRHARLRDALVAAMLPSPGGGLPAAGDVDLSAFWPRFDAAAPIHVRLAFAAATIGIAGVLPLTLGHRHTLEGLDEDARDAVLQRAAKLKAVAPLLDIVKIVVAFAYFDDPHVEAIARGRT